MSEKKSIIKNKSFAFAMRFVWLYQYLVDTKKEVKMKLSKNS